jgi:hypothetical protein
VIGLMHILVTVLAVITGANVASGNYGTATFGAVTAICMCILWDK